MGVQRTGLGGEVLHQALDQNAQVEALGPDRQLAGADARYVEHVLDQADQAVDLPFVTLDHGLELVFTERCQVAAVQVHAPQLGFEDQAVERCAHLVGDDRHEIVAHAHRALQFAARHLQLGQQLLLLGAAAFQRLQLTIEGLALAEKVDEHRHFALHRQGVQRLVQKSTAPLSYPLNA